MTEIALTSLLILAPLVMISGVVFAVDTVWRRFQSTTPNASSHPNRHGDNTMAFVVLPTYQERTMLLMKDVIAQLVDYGVVHRIDGAPTRFDAARITLEALYLVRQNRRVVIIAPGSGLMLAIDIALALEAAAGREVSIISIDGIPSSTFISPKKLEIARLPLGPVANWLMKQARRLGKWSRWNYAPSLWRDYMRFIRTWGPESRPKAALIYIRSERTQEHSLFMAPDRAGYLVADGSVCTLPVPDAGELDIRLYPQRYQAAVARALELLEIERVE